MPVGITLTCYGFLLFKPKEFRCVCPDGKHVFQCGFETALLVWEKERKVTESPFMSELMSMWMLDKIENPRKPLRPGTETSIRSWRIRSKLISRTPRLKKSTRHELSDKYARRTFLIKREKISATTVCSSCAVGLPPPGRLGSNSPADSCIPASVTQFET